MPKRKVKRKTKQQKKEKKNENSLIEQYYESLSDMEKKAYVIAKEDLGTSFNVEKSIGYLNWLSKNKV